MIHIYREFDSHIYLYGRSKLDGLCGHAVFAYTYANAHASLPMAAADGKRRGAQAQSSRCKDDAYLCRHSLVGESVVAKPSASFAFCKLPCCGLAGITSSLKDVKVVVYAVYQARSNGVFGCLRLAGVIRLNGCSSVAIALAVACSYGLVGGTKIGAGMHIATMTAHQGYHNAPRRSVGMHGGCEQRVGM